MATVFDIGSIDDPSLSQFLIDHFDYRIDRDIKFYFVHEKGEEHFPALSVLPRVQAQQQVFGH